MNVISIRHTLLALLVLFVCVGALPRTAAAEALSFSITPTIFDMMAAPQQAWSSGVKVVNNNDYDITVYASAVNFTPQGERGHGSFIPVAPSDDGLTLASWMQVPNDPIVVPKESSVVVPVQISVPADASPGGHYAAIMIGTRPPVESGQLSIKTAQIITALFFVRVAGDVVEQGDVRTFRAAHRFVTTPNMDFLLRFENTGTVHLQPQGDIRIRNMWGRERGIIPINHESNFGNVLPDSIRLFEYAWRGEPSLLDFGHYTAELTLAYGTDVRKFETRTIGFWVIPVKPLAVALVIVLAVVWFVVRSIRAYVQYMLRMSGIDPTQQSATLQKRYVMHDGDVRIERVPVPITEPVTAGYKDLRARLEGVHKLLDVLHVVWNFIRSYPRFFAAFGVVIVLCLGLVWYVQLVRVEQRGYEVTVDSASGPPVTLSSEEILYDSTHAQDAEAYAANEQPYDLRIVNAGAPVGTGGGVADQLTAAGYRIDDLTADIDNPKNTSVIIYDPSLSEVATALSDALGGVLISAYPSVGSTTAITIFLGSDYSE